MNILALNSSEGIGLYGGKLVFSASETQALRSCIETADYLQRMKGDAVELLEQSRLKTEEQGFQQGLQLGRDEANKELAASLLAQQRELQQAQQDIRDRSVVIALEIVKKIAGNLAPEQLVLSLAQTAAKELAPDSIVTLRTHTDNIESLKQLLYKQSSSDSKIMQFIKITGDDNLALDGCVLDTALGSIEADLNTQLAAIEQYLMRG